MVMSNIGIKAVRNSDAKIFPKIRGAGGFDRLVGFNEIISIDKGNQN